MFTERDQKRRLKHYSARLKNKLRLEKARLKKLKRKWKWIVAIAVLLAGLLGWSAGHYMSARIPASDEAGSLRVEP